MKYDYDYFPELTEVTQQEAQNMLDAYNAGELELHPEILRIVKRTAAGE